MTSLHNHTARRQKAEGRRQVDGWVRLVGFLIALGLCGELHAQTAAALEAQLKAEQDALDSLKTQLASEEQRLEQSQKKKQTEAEALSQLERNIFQVKGELRTVQRRERDLAQRLGTTEQRLRRSEAQVNNREAGMAQRARDLYKLGRRGTLEIIFSSASFSDAVRRLRYLSRVADQDRRDYQALQTERQRVSRLYAVQGTQHRQQQTLLQGQLKKEQTLQRLASDKARTVKQLERDTAARLQVIRDMRAQEAEYAARIAQRIKELREARLRGKRLAKLPAFDFAVQKGQLQWPVRGRVVTRFGRQQDPDLKTWTFNRGVNIATETDTPVLAVAPGEVVMVDWFPGYGRFVLLRHPDDYFTLYGHLNSDQVRIGEILAEGTVLGTAGSTGRLDGKTQLHFEIMLGEDPLDPALWLGDSH